MQGLTSGLSSKQEKAVVALMSEVTLEAAARVVGVNQVTLWRWMKEPDFRKAYLAARRQVVDNAIALMRESERCERQHPNLFL